MNFICHEFDKLVLGSIVLFFSGVAIYAYTHTGEAALSSFATDQAKLFAGALLALITGRLARSGGSESQPDKSRSPQP